MNIPGLTVAKMAEGEVKPRAIVCYGSNDGQAKQAIDGSIVLIGVSTIVGGADGEIFDIVRSGIAPVTYGGTVALGAPITADSTGRAITASEGDFIIGYAEVAGDIDEIGSVWIAPTKQA